MTKSLWQFNCIFLLLFIEINLNVHSVNSVAVHERAFRNPYTSTVIKSQVVTSLVPSSCVQVATTLPPCKSVRYLRFPKLPSVTFNNPANEEVISNWRTDPKIETTRLGWGEYFGFYAPTVTITKTDLHISTVQDPSVVVTFAVKGCKPLKLPLDLDRCPPEELPSISIEEILPTSTIVQPIIPTETLLPTKTMSALTPSSTLYGILSDFPEQPTFHDGLNLLEPSAQEQTENIPSKPTATLPLGS